MTGPDLGFPGGCSEERPAGGGLTRAPLGTQGSLQLLFRLPAASLVKTAQKLQLGTSIAVSSTAHLVSAGGDCAGRGGACPSPGARSLEERG